MARLQAHDWPGNIRELRNVLDRARLFADDGVVRAEHLPESVGHTEGRAAQASPGSPFAPMRGRDDDAELTRLAQEGRLTRLEMAQKLGLSERTLYRRIRALGLA